MGHSILSKNNTTSKITFKKSVCLALLLLATHAFALTPQKVIIDTDMDFDDWLAILYLLHQPNVEVKAITIVQTGAAGCPLAAQNALALIQLAGKHAIPVACGVATPLSEQPLLADKTYRNKAEHLDGIAIPAAKEKISTLSATQLIANTLKTYPQQIIVVAIGPLTNIAQWLEQYPEQIHRIQKIVIMGGVLTDKGNVHEAVPAITNTTAEWNFYADVTASAKVMRSHLPITLVPLDATKAIPITHDIVTHLNGHNQQTAFIRQVLQISLDDTKRYGQSYFWDPLAAMQAVNPEICHVQALSLSIVTQPGAEYGRVVLDKNGQTMNVCVQVDAQRFYFDYIDNALLR